MNKYLTFQSKGFGYQIISINSINQTFQFNKYFNGLKESIEGRFTQELKSNLNYQLVVL